MIGKILSLVVAVTYLVAAQSIGGGELVLRTLIYLILPMACIWFGDELGEWTGTVSLHSVSSRSPGCLVRLMGWVLLLLLGIIHLVTKGRWQGIL